MSLAWGERYPYGGDMSEPPRPPGGDAPGQPPDPTALPPPSPGSYAPPGDTTGSGYAPPPSAPPSSSAPWGGSPAAPPPGEHNPPPPEHNPPPPEYGSPPPQYGSPPPEHNPPPGQYGSPPPGQYGSPPGSGYVPPGGYQTGGFPPGGGGFGSADDKTFALVAHFGGVAGAVLTLGVLGFVGPLIAYLAKGQQSPAIRAHAVAALNFQLLWSVLALPALLLSFCTFGISTFAVMAVQVIFGVIGGLKANDGRVYKYPMSVAFIK